MNLAWYNVVNDRLFLLLGGEMTFDQKCDLEKAGFQWWPRGVWTGTWTPFREDVLLKEFGVTAIEDRPEEDDPEARAERLAGRAEVAAERSDAAYERAHKIADRIEPGQPILVGHHSEKRHRADLGRIDRAMQTSHDEQEKAQEYARRADAAILRAERREEPDAIKKRIEKLEAQRRSMELDVKRTLRRFPDAKVGWSQRWIAHFDRRLEYERARYAASGGTLADREAPAFAVGGWIQRRGGAWYEIVRVNKKSLTVKVIIPHMTPWESKIDKDDVIDYSASGPGPAEED